MEADDNAFFEQVFEIIEAALEAEGYRILDGDSDTACVVSSDGIHFDIKLRMCDDD